MDIPAYSEPALATVVESGLAQGSPGFGLKFDAFVTDPGLFAGLAANYAWAKYSLRRADASISPAAMPLRLLPAN